MIDRIGPLESSFIMLLFNTTSVDLISLDLWPSESGTIEIVAYGWGGGGQKVLGFLKRDSWK